YNLQNALAATTVGLALDFDPEEIQRALDSVPGVPGRLQRVPGAPGDPSVFVDYAHSDQALASVLAALRPLTPGRLICVFGAGGDRDQGKRPLMGEIGGRLADFSILTSDNPRTENPETILEAIEEGMKPTSGEYIVIENRREAIRYALDIAEEGDIVILAGKGHETYQDIMGVKRPFDEKVVVNEMLEEKLRKA
ncbi:MAG: cyanophycin synthetase, partial [Bacillota bacterium]